MKIRILIIIIILIPFYPLTKISHQLISDIELIDNEVFNSKIIHNNKMSVYEKDLRMIAHKYKFNPEYLFKVLYFESRNKATAKNPNSSAYGIIQVMSETLADSRFKRKDVYNMNRWEQVKYIVDPYFSPYKGKIKSLEDCYLCVFWPSAITKSDNYVLQTKKKSAKRIATDNPKFDINHDNKVTKGEIKEYFNNFDFPKSKKKLLNI